MTTLLFLCVYPGDAAQPTPGVDAVIASRHSAEDTPAQGGVGLAG